MPCPLGSEGKDPKPEMQLAGWVGAGRGGIVVYSLREFALGLAYEDPEREPGWEDIVTLVGSINRDSVKNEVNYFFLTPIYLFWETVCVFVHTSRGRS